MITEVILFFLFQVSWTKDGNYLKTENYAAIENAGADFEGDGEHILSITSLDETGICQLIFNDKKLYLNTFKWA